MPPRRSRVEVGEPPGSGASSGRVQRNVLEIETLDARPFGQLQTTTDLRGKDASTFHLDHAAPRFIPCQVNISHTNFASCESIISVLDGAV